jgi:hypothetical protein
MLSLSESIAIYKRRSFYIILVPLKTLSRLNLIEENRKLGYYKEVINPNLEDQKYLYILSSLKKKINIDKIRVNSHELHSGTMHCKIPKIP